MTPNAAPYPGPARPVRPATVTVASVLQFVLAGTLLLVIALTVADAVHYDGLIDQAARSTGESRADVDSERSANLFGALIVALPALLLAGWSAVSAWWVRRGSNVARIMALVGFGAPLLLGLVACLVGGLGSLLLAGLLLAPPGGAFPEEGGAFPEEGGAFPEEGGAFPEEPQDEDVMEFGDGAFYDELWRLDSGGWSAVSDALGLTAAAMAVMLAVSAAVLLLTGTSNRYFRPQRAVPPRPHLHGGPPPPAGYPAPPYHQAPYQQPPYHQPPYQQAPYQQAPFPSLSPVREAPPVPDSGADGGSRPPAADR